MKKFVFFVFLSFCIQESYSQIDFPVVSKDISNMLTVDSGYLRILYAFNAVDIANPKTYEDLHRLEIGTYMSKYYSYTTYQYDSLCTCCAAYTKEWLKKHPHARSVSNCCGSKPKWSEYYWSEYIRDFSKDIIGVYVWMPVFMPSYFYTENIPVQDWKLHEDTLHVSGYLCQKATCRYRGRNFIAWFTPDIPVNNGPWKFGGLPGLILKVYDEGKDDQYIFECIGIENFKIKYPIEMLDYKDYKKIERKKLWKLQQDLHDNINNVIPGMKTVESELPPRYPKFVYHPLELE